MSPENVEMVRGLWEPFKGVDLATVDWDDEAIREMSERFWSPEVELRWSRSGPEARVYQGRDGVIQAFREWVEPFREYYIEPLDFIEREDRVIIPQRHRGIGSTSGVSVEDEFTHVYEVRDHVITRVDEYDTLKEALEAVGLSESAMSQENMERAARQLAEGVSEKNLAVILAVSDPEIEFTSRFTAVEGRTYQGHAGWAAYLADADVAWENFRITVEECILAGPERLIAVERVEALARGSGVQLDQPTYAVQQFRDGKVLRMRTYRSRQEALEAAGLSEQGAHA
jgi:ketosteroid isomerase-like protein